MYKIKVDEHGNILEQYRSPEVTPVHNTTIEGFLWLENPYVLDYKVEYWNGTSFTTRTPAPEKWFVWEGSWVESQSLKNIVIGQTLILVRLERDSLLFNSDWTQFKDSPLTETKQAEWATYRQSLRDFPSALSDVTDIEVVTWPAKPI